MKRGKPLVDTRQYYVVNPTGQRERGDFTREEAVAQAKRKEQELKEWGYPRTKHRVVYGPTGEDVHFEGARTMAKRRRRRRVSLGDTALVHAHKLRKALQHYKADAERALNFANNRQCTVAQEVLEDANRMRGQVEVHMDSLGRKRLFAQKTINLAAIGRTMIAARKALEKNCGREPAVRR